MTSLATFLSLTLATGAWAAPAAAPIRTAAVPGGIARVVLPATAQAPQVRYRGERVLVRANGQGWVALVGLPLSVAPGPATLEVDGRSVPFTIHPKRYPEQHLTLKNLRQVNPNPEDEVRIAREQALIGPQWQAWPAGLTPALRFQQPTPGRLTASFGMRRFFNGEARNPHPGLDIAAPKGRAVGAPAAGVVLLTGDFFFSGNTVLIGHGEGVVSLLCHLTDVTVQAGQALQPGQLIGHVGSTGRATGPHLHWTLSFNNARVDPGLALKATRP
jgi:murein DD-endopeptidase MepM/ murein hydrolase activator NlpD